MVNESDMTADELDIKKAQMIAEEAEGGSRVVSGPSKWIVPILAVSWSVFQLLTASVLLLDATLIRSVHLAFAICLVYLTHPMFKKNKKRFSYKNTYR